MLSSIQYVTENIESQPWDVNISGLDFEERIYDLLSRELENYYNSGVRIEKTVNTRDGGIDIIIHSSVSLNIFGQSYLIKGKSEIIIYVECKISKNLNLSLDKFSKNLLLLKDKNIDYFLLLTNSTISPHAFYRAQEECVRNNIDFKYIGQYLLFNYLNSKFPDLIDKLNCNMIQDRPNLSISYQTENAYVNGKLGLNLYLCIRNNDSKPHIFDMKLKSDRNWLLSENKFEIGIDSMETISKKITIEKVNFDGNNDILLDVFWEGNRKTVQVSGVNLEYNFILPFSGDKHKKILQQIVNMARKNNKLCQFLLIGEAGIGKTRIIDEIFNNLSVTGFTGFRVFIEKDQNINKIYEKIRKSLGLKKSKSQDSLYHVLRELESNCFKRFFISIEDIHNASENFFEELKALNDFKSNGSPIFLNFSGRNDQYVYNEPYCSYIDWIKTEGTNSTVVLKNVEKLEELECKNLIISLINDAPVYVIDKINHMSQGNPFYLIQYIEYLLETKLIYLVNKNTVGITNAATFDQHLYVPEKIEDILHLRINIIKKQYPEVFDFLLILSYVGYSCSTDYWYCFFNELKQKEYNFLFSNHILKLTNNEIAFDHESIYLVLKKMLCDKVIKNKCFDIYVKNSHLFNILPKLKKGEIYIYQNQIEKAKECFELPIKELRNISNISSVNLTPSFYDYYMSIYFIAKKQKDNTLQMKTILGLVYTAMHNLPSGKAIESFAQAETWIIQDFKTNIHLKTSILILKAHHLMSIGQMSKAKGLILEILSEERIYPNNFEEQSRFNIFDRAASMYLQENHIIPANYYNKLSMNVAKKLNDSNLLVLAKIVSAKINFYIYPKNSLKYINEAETLMATQGTRRIKCHNNIGKLTVKILLDKDHKYAEFIQEANDLLNESIDISYPLAIIRCRYILAVLYYMRGENQDISFSKKYLDEGIETSIRNGNIKLLANYYNLKLIVAEKEQQPFDTLRKYANTMLEYLKQQDSLFIGELDFGNCNIINITNYAIFSFKHLSENESSEFQRQIKFYGSESRCDNNCSSNKKCIYSCTQNINIFFKNYKRTEKGYLMFVNKKYKLIDKDTNYFIPLGI